MVSIHSACVEISAAREFRNAELLWIPEFVAAVSNAENRVFRPSVTDRVWLEHAPLSMHVSEEIGLLGIGFGGYTAVDVNLPDSEWTNHFDDPSYEILLGKLFIYKNDLYK